jgi:hypothetical protein
MDSACLIEGYPVIDHSGHAYIFDARSLRIYSSALSANCPWNDSTVLSASERWTSCVAAPYSAAFVIDSAFVNFKVY